MKLATDDFGPKVSNGRLTEKTAKFYVYMGDRDGKNPIRVVDRKGFIKVQCSHAEVLKCKAKDYKDVVSNMWKDLATFKTDSVLRPDYYLCVGPRVCDYAAVELEQNILLMEMDVMDRDPEEELIVVGSINDIR